jgi:hypothetical protein
MHWSFARGLLHSRYMHSRNSFSVSCSARARLALAAALLAAPAAIYLVSPTALHAQQKLRTVEGTVRDAGGQPVSSAIVYLKNASSLTIRTYVTTADGIFRFGQVGMDADFQVWAESSGSKSGVKTISSFDSKQKWDITLRLTKK